MSVYEWKQLEMAEKNWKGLKMAGNGWKWLEMDDKGWKHPGNSQKQLYLARNT